MPQPTQVRRPWRATIRTGFAVLVALCSIAPYLYAGATLGDPDQATGLLGQVLAVAAGVTRVMALPQVEMFLRRYFPWLAADPTTRPGERGHVSPLVIAAFVVLLLVVLIIVTPALH